MKAVLVAEDEPLARWSVSEFLRREGFEVAEADDGETAMELIDHEPFDIVISDYSLAGKLNGVDVLRHYHERRPEKLKVLITGQNGDAQADAEAIGGIYLRKPVFLEDLLAIVNSRIHE
jgi:DNA-binding NtrC family response regulator